MLTKEYKAEDLRLTWRLLAAPTIGQLIGAGLGYLIPLNPSQFMSLWIGGASGTFAGFWCGVWWHFKEKTRRKRIPYFTIIVVELNRFAVA